MTRLVWGFFCLVFCFFGFATRTEVRLPMAFQKQHCSDQSTGTEIPVTVLPAISKSVLADATESTVCPIAKWIKTFLIPLYLRVVPSIIQCKISKA